MSMQQSLIEAMHLPEDSDVVAWIHPHDKDRAQAAALIAAIQKHAAE